MMQFPEVPQRPRHREELGFSLLELLIVLATIMLLIGIILPATRLVQRSARKTSEMSAARQLMVGYVAYATDHRGKLMPGYYNKDGQLLPAEDEWGVSLVDLAVPVAAARYPWRLAPYLNYNFKGLYLDDRTLSAMRNDDLYHYTISLFPSFGINGVFVGGDSDDGFAFDDLYEGIFGKFYVQRLSQAKNPANLIVFCSARSDDEFAPANLTLIEGHHKVLPPYLADRKWDTKYAPDTMNASNFGFVSMRDYKAAIIGFLDGHTGQLDDGQIQNMKYWADQATAPDWTLQPK